MSEKTLEEMRQILVGSTVTAIDPPDAGKSECICKIVAEKGGTTTEFHLHATDLGFWITGAKSQPSSGPPIYNEVGHVFDEMSDVLCADDDDDVDLTPFEAVDDPKTRRLGFRHRKSGREWWFTLRTAKASPWAHEFATPESRAALVQRFSETGFAPRPTERF